MLKPDFSDDTTAVAFKFFYWFSRFEFALKENGYLKSALRDASAEPGWGPFVQKFCAKYSMSESALSLVRSAPRRQVVAQNSELEWRSLAFKNPNELQTVVIVLKTVRNNLFHGGKSGPNGWSDPNRLVELITSAQAVLDELAAFSDLNADYHGIY